MRQRTTKRARRLVVTAGVVALSTASSASGAIPAVQPGWPATGPSTSVPPYLLPVTSGVSIQSLFTVGDQPAGNGYRMVGIPDGLGAYGTPNRTEVLMNHELGADKGIVRRHGQEGALGVVLK